MTSIDDALRLELAAAADLVEESGICPFAAKLLRRVGESDTIRIGKHGYMPEFAGDGDRYGPREDWYKTYTTIELMKDHAPASP